MSSLNLILVHTWVYPSSYTGLLVLKHKPHLITFSKQQYTGLTSPQPRTQHSRICPINKTKQKPHIASSQALHPHPIKKIKIRVPTSSSSQIPPITKTVHEPRQVFQQATS